LARPSYSFSLTLLVLLLCSLGIVFPSQINDYLPSRILVLSAGIILLFFLTGYSTIKLIKKYLPSQNNLLEQLCLSIGLSLVIVIIATSILSAFLVVSSLSVLLTLGGISLAFSILSEGPWFRLGDRNSFPKREEPPSTKRTKFSEPASVALIALWVGIVCFVFFIHPFLSGQSNGLAYSFATNNNLADLVLLVLVTSLLIYRFRNEKKLAGFVTVLVLTIALLLSLKARSYPALVSFGLGDRVGIDSWDSLGHLIAFLGSGRYSLTEPFLWLVRNGQIMASPNPFPPGYFSLMGATAMLLQVDPLTLTRSVFLFGVLQTLFIYLLTKKLTGDTVKSLMAALLIACGTATSENIKFTSGALSPIAGIGLALVPLGLYLLTLAKTKLTRILVVLVALGLLYVHLASAIVYILIVIVFYFKPEGKPVPIKNYVKTLWDKIAKNRTYVISACMVVLAISAPIAIFWYQTYSNPNAQYSVHYSERFTFTLPSAQEIAYVPSFTENALFFILLVYGIASYFFASRYRKEGKFLLYWNLALIVLYLLLFYTNPKIAYRILAYLYQSASVIAACAFVHDVLERRSSNSFKSLKKRLAALLLLSTLLFAAFYPVFEEPSTPDGIFLQQSTQQKPYFDLANWINANLTTDSAVIVNNCSSFSDPVNILRDMGITMIVGTNLTAQDYENINGNFTSSYVLDAPNYSPGINCTQTDTIYSSQISNSSSFIKLYKLTSVLNS